MHQGFFLRRLRSKRKPEGKNVTKLSGKAAYRSLRNRARAATPARLQQMVVLVLATISTFNKVVFLPFLTCMDLQ